MTLEEINEMWAKDARIDDTNLGSEATKIPQLHNKYYMLYSQEALRMRKYKAELKELEFAKYEYYIGTMTEEDMKTRGWKPNPLKILRADVNKYIECDKEIIRISLKIDYHMQMANYLEDIIKQVNK